MDYSDLLNRVQADLGEVEPVRLAPLLTISLPAPPALFNTQYALNSQEGAVDRYVARANVQHFRDLVANETSLPERERLKKMLLEEEAKLAQAERLHAEEHKRH